ncbi:hypothetical protein HPB49_015257 [Dermacentor silvarum]|uniref:Uncharacterized protein n=1 Tax=Dermacentor silvarum TaxID=543639 RepID=A0ACB8CY25_DERSI|nr:hypothetical protein HPB49_015257 [Dermacentor silvarum]
MQLSSRAKHLLHCCLCVGLILAFEVFTGGIHLWKFSYDDLDPLEQYGWPLTIVLYLMRLLTVLALPQCICNCLGLLLYNAFPEKVRLKGSPLLAPFICIRVVTRGDYPDLVRTNVARNIETCAEVGLENFIVEIVTDKPLGLTKHPRIRILNFALDGKHAFGQGLITYANERVVNWVTTLADSFRVADDMGKLRFQFWAFHRPLFSWKGSYVVTRAGAERKVSFDHGPDGSIAEDCFFSMVAYREGYTFDFIPGEMWEKSPFSFWDFLQQRKRWLQGIFLVVHSSTIPLRHKLFLALALYSWATIPLSTSNLILAAFCPIPCPALLNFLCAFVGAMNLYMYIFGVIKSFSLYRMGPDQKYHSWQEKPA